LFLSTEAAPESCSGKNRKRSPRRIFLSPTKIMKPTPQNTTTLPETGERSPLSQSTFPVTDYAFQNGTPISTAQSSASKERREAEVRSFRTISRHFMEVGARREYLVEGLVFAWITLTAAGPLGVLVRQLTTMMIRYQ
jgi:hypothetical protein